MSSTRRVGPPMMFETLEARRLLSFTYTNEDGTLTILGTDAADKISVGMSAAPTPRVTITDETRTVFISDVFEPREQLPSRIILKGGAGADRLSVHEMFYQAGVRVYGGRGVDRIVLNSNTGFPARVWGGDGNDQISLVGGGARSDAQGYSHWGESVIVRGGRGNDVINHFALHDEGGPTIASARLFGGAGNDQIFGGDGADRIDGGAGRDILRGNAGDDTLRGGAGRDRLFGGDGRDRIKPD